MKRAAELMFLAWVNAMFLIGTDVNSRHFTQCCVMSVACALVGFLCYLFLEDKQT